MKNNPLEKYIEEMELMYIALLNDIYEEEGFDGVVEYIARDLEMGTIEVKSPNIYCFSTGGWSHDEIVIDSLVDLCNIFGQKHYIGRLRGGHYYFAKNKGEFEIVEIDKN